MTTNALDNTKPVREGEELNAARLCAWLRDNLPDAAGGLCVEQFPGGHSNLTYLLRVGSTEMVLRRPPFGNRVKSAHDMGREFRVLSKLHRVYAPAPRPFAYCEDESVIGAPFYLMERRRGLVVRHTRPDIALDEPTVRTMCAALIDNLAALHAIDYEAAGLADLGRPEGYAVRQIEGWAKRYFNAKTYEHAELEQVIVWLRERRPPDGGAAILHNDYKFDNVMFDPRDVSRIVGVFDWEMSTLGDPLMDLGVTLACWDEPGETGVQLGDFSLTKQPGALTRQQLADAYAARTGRDVSNAVFYYCFGLFKMAAIVQQIYWRYVNGHTRDPRFARFDETVAALGRAAARAVATNRL
jgi:aminoglycoside phosphotransferase (APT) family kinase protein